MMESSESSVGHDRSEGQEKLVWRILLADKEPAHRLILARLLKRAGYDVEAAGNGREALARIQAGDFQMLITDWEMPEMDGIALCSAVRSSGITGYIYAILLTARDGVEHVVTGLQAGADDYLTKPVIEPELMARLNTGKRIVSLERALRAANEANARLSIIDSLTGVYNRRYLMEQLSREIAFATRRSLPLSVLMFDIDKLKHVNDTHGHTAGGQVLIAVANLLRPEVETAGGWLAHYGGDEFVIVLPSTFLSSTIDLAQRLRDMLSREVIEIGGAGIRVTASFGVSGWDRGAPRDIGAEDMLRSADECLYESKSAGRNRVSVKALS